MSSTTTALIKRARSLADLPNTAFISYEDEVNSLNEAYKQAYTKLTESNDDYFVSTTTLTVDPNTKILNDIYVTPLPSDFFQLRSVSYDNMGQWSLMDKYATKQANTKLSRPTYRLQNNNILIKQPSFNFISSIQIEYYAKPTTLSKQQQTISYLPSTRDLSGIAAAFYVADQYNTVDETDYLFYITNSTIRVTSYKKGTDVEILPTTSGISMVKYWNGWVFWLQSGVVKKATTDFSTALTGIQTVTGAAAVTNYSISNNILTYDDAGTVKYISLVSNSSGTATPTAGTTEWVSIIGGWRWIEGGFINGTTIPAQKIYYTPDGNVYFISNDSYLYRLDYVNGTPTSTLIRTDVYNPQDSDGLDFGYITEKNVYPLSTLSIAEETVLDYPNNMFWEVIAMLAAIDFKLKQNADATALEKKLIGTMATLEQSLQRDEYTVARMNNYYATEANFFNTIR